MQLSWDLPEFCLTEGNNGQQKLAISNVGRALGFRDRNDTHEKYRETPMHELHERILMLDRVFNSMTSGKLRKSAAVKHKINAVFRELGPHIWPESKDRSVWLVSASEESRIEYPWDLYYIIPEHRELLGTLFLSWAILCILALRLKRFARSAQQGAESAAKESGSMKSERTAHGSGIPPHGHSESGADENSSIIAIRPKRHRREVASNTPATAVEPNDDDDDDDDPHRIEWIER